MRKMYLMMLATLTVLAAVAQNNVVNGNFEQWEDSVSFIEPQNWNSNNPSTLSLGNTVTDTTDAQKDSLAAVVRTVYSVSLDEYFGGFLTNGTRNPDSLGTNGWQINYRPDKFSGYYKYFPTPGDTARVILYMYEYDQNGDTNKLVATGNTRLTTATEWTYFEFPVLNAFPGSTTPIPDSYVILITSTNLNAPAQGISTLMIDNLNFIEPVAAPTLDDASDILIYPNPVEDYFVISSPTHRVIGASVLSAEGRHIQSINSVSGANDLMVNTGRLSKGFYYVQIQFENGAVETRFITVVK